MRRVPHLACCVAAALALGACGKPVAPTPAANAAAPPPATTTAAVLDPKGTLDATRAAAGAASAAVVARQAAVQAGAPAPSVASPAAVASEAAPALNGPAAPAYDAKGRRDPFEPLDVKLGSERSTLSSAKLTGIVQGGNGPTALVETSDGIGYILKPGDTLADGRVTEIGNNLVVFSIAPKPGGQSNRVVLKLATD
jgi:hypothetical protein